MTRILAILTVVSFVVLPLHFSVRAMCDCAPQVSLANAPVSLFGSEAPGSCCCPGSANRPGPAAPNDSPQESDRPCGDEGCPMPCCGMVKTFAAPTALPAVTATAHLVHTATPADTGSAMSPHIGALTRPPIHAAAL